MQTVVRAGLGLCQALFHSFEELALKRATWHSNRTLDDLYVVLSGFDVRIFELYISITFIRGYKAARYLNPFSSQLHYFVHIPSIINSSGSHNRNFLIVFFFEKGHFTHHIGNQIFY